MALTPEAAVLALRDALEASQDRNGDVLIFGRRCNAQTLGESLIAWFADRKAQERAEKQMKAFVPMRRSA